MTGATNTLSVERFKDVSHRLYAEKSIATTEKKLDALSMDDSIESPLEKWRSRP